MFMLIATECLKRSNKWSRAVRVYNTSQDYASQFHVWEMSWNQHEDGRESHIVMRVDGRETWRLTAPGPPGGLWDMAGLEVANKIYSLFLLDT